MDYFLLHSFWVMIQETQINTLIKFFQESDSNLVKSLINTLENKQGALNLKQYLGLANYTYSRIELIRDLINFRLMTMIDAREENFCQTKSSSWLHGDAEPSYESLYASCPLTCALNK